MNKMYRSLIQTIYLLSLSIAFFGAAIFLILRAVHKYDGLGSALLYFSCWLLADIILIVLWACIKRFRRWRTIVKRRYQKG